MLLDMLVICDTNHICILPILNHYLCHLIGAMKFFEEQRKEVMKHIEKYMLEKMSEFLKPVDTIWQPSDLLPDSTRETFFSEIKELQESSAGLSYDLIAVLIGDTITEEALPTYESWLTMVEGVSKEEEGGWMKW